MMAQGTFDKLNDALQVQLDRLMEADEDSVDKEIKRSNAESLRTCMNIARMDKARHDAQCRPRACKKYGEVFKPRFANNRTCDKCLGRE